MVRLRSPQVCTNIRIEGFFNHSEPGKLIYIARKQGIHPLCLVQKHAMGHDAEPISLIPIFIRAVICLFVQIRIRNKW